MNKKMENVSIEEENTLTSVEQELAIMFLATSFLKLFLNSNIERRADVLEYDNAHKLYNQMSKVCNVYIKKADHVIAIATPILEKIEEDARKLQLKTAKFEKRLRVNSENELEISGLVFITALILEHSYLKHRTFRLPYKLAETINISYSYLETKTAGNARVLSRKFVKTITKGR